MQGAFGLHVHNTTKHTKKQKTTQNLKIFFSACWTFWISISHLYKQNCSQCRQGPIPPIPGHWPTNRCLHAPTWPPFMTKLASYRIISQFLGNKRQNAPNVQRVSKIFHLCFCLTFGFLERIGSKLVWIETFAYPYISPASKVKTNCKQT